MADPSPKSPPQISWAFDSFTPSPASADGPPPPGSPASPTISRSGPVRARADGIGGADADRARSARGMGDSGGDRARQHSGELPGDETQHDLGATDRDHAPVPTGATRGFWAGCDWVWCKDGVYRPTKPGTQPLAHGTSGRVAIRRANEQAIAAYQEEGTDPDYQETAYDEEHWYNRTGALSGCGNAIVRQVAAAFLQSAFEAISDLAPS